MELLLIRHGLPIRIDDAGGPADPPLSPDGVAQAEALAAWLAPRGIDALYCSPLRRARETAAPLVDALGLDVVVDAGVEEYDAHLPEYIPIEELRADPVRWKQAVDEWTSTEANDLRQAFRRRDQRLPLPCDRAPRRDLLRACLHEREPGGGRRRATPDGQRQRDAPSER